MNIYRHIDRSKIQFDFVIHTDRHCDFTDEIFSLGGRIYSVPRYTGKNHFQYVQAWKSFFESHPEYKIIHGHVRSTASIYLKIAKKYGLYTIAHSHSTSSGIGFSAKVKNLFQLNIRNIADYFMACSTEAGEWLFGKKVVQSDKFQVLKNAIDSKKYVFSSDNRSKIRNELNLGNRFVIGHIGSFGYPKNHIYILDIFKEIHEENRDAFLILVGDGPLKNTVIDKANILGIRDSIIFAGVRSDVPELLSAMDVFVLPSVYEGLGIVAIEAQASGLPTICSENVPKETRITDLCEFVSLNETPRYWAEIVLTHSTTTSRTDMNSYICNAGYDINNTVNKLAAFYMNVLDRLGK